MSAFGFNKAKIFADSMFDMNDIVAGLDVGGFIHAFLFFEAAGVAGVGTTMGVVGVEITFGDNCDLFGGVVGAFMNHAEVELKLIKAGKGGIEFLEAGRGALSLKIEVICFSGLGLIATVFNKGVPSGFGLCGGVGGRGSMKSGLIDFIGCFDKGGGGSGISWIDDEGVGG